MGCERLRSVLTGQAHFFSIPLLAAPAMPLVINDAGTATTAALVVFHFFVPINVWLARLNVRKK